MADIAVKVHSISYGNGGCQCNHVISTTPKTIQSRAISGTGTAGDPNGLNFNITYMDNDFAFNSATYITNQPLMGNNIRKSIERYLTSVTLTDAHKIMISVPYTCLLQVTFEDLGGDPDSFTIAQAGTGYINMFNISALKGLLIPPPHPLDILPNSFNILDTNTSAVSNTTTIFLPIALIRYWEQLRSVSLDPAITPVHIAMTVNTAPLKPAFPPYPTYDFSDNYTTSLDMIPFKATIVHEIIHGLGWIQYLSSNIPILYDAFLFASPPANLTEFSTKQRIGTSNSSDVINALTVKFTDGTFVPAIPIDISTSSHLLAAGGTNGLMEPFITTTNSFPKIADQLGLVSLGWTNNLAICILPGALVMTDKGLIKIEQLKAGDMVINELGEEVKVICNFASQIPKDGVQAICFNHGSLGPNKPDGLLMISHNHPIKINPGDVEEVVQNFVGDNIVDVKQCADYMYSICTADRIFVQVNGIYVCTWSEQEFEKYSLDLRSKGFHIPLTKL